MIQWIRPVVFENVRKVLACRTPVLGCHICQCKDSGTYKNIHRQLVKIDPKNRDLNTEVIRFKHIIAQKLHCVPSIPSFHHSMEVT